ncbi:MAG: hypothetical protein HY340_00460 [Candidatus Kerfeldbacteria bacterium]|nr:hypothetical protein [Candidatus Kerfeldbacteria bacterium]
MRFVPCTLLALMVSSAAAAFPQVTWEAQQPVEFSGITAQYTVSDITVDRAIISVAPGEQFLYPEITNGTWSATSYTYYITYREVGTMTTKVELNVLKNRFSSGDDAKRPLELLYIAHSGNVCPGWMNHVETSGASFLAGNVSPIERCKRIREAVCSMPPSKPVPLGDSTSWAFISGGYIDQSELRLLTVLRSPCRNEGI